MSGLPRLALHGSPRQRGQLHGEQAAQRVRRSVDAYREVFAELAGWDWDRVVAEARRYLPAIEAFGTSYLEELRGIAEGAGLDEGDVLAINTRTEVMFAARARKALGLPDDGDVPGAGGDVPGAGGGHPGRGECTALAVLPSRARDGHTLLAQNWDWLVHCQDTVVVLDVTRDDGPDYLTVVEAGLLAKTGMNDAGLGIATNALVTAGDRGEPGVPYHVMLRGLLDAPTLSDALGMLHSHPRSSSANYLLAHRDGLAIDVEAAPGNFTALYLLDPVDGLVLHTNHLLSPRFTGTDVSVWAMPDSPVRLQRLRGLIATHDGAIGEEHIRSWLGDHANHPAGVCCHPEPTLPRHEQDATVVSVVMDLSEGVLWLADGHPCSEPYEPLRIGETEAGR